MHETMTYDVYINAYYVRKITDGNNKIEMVQLFTIIISESKIIHECSLSNVKQMNKNVINNARGKMQKS